MKTTLCLAWQGGEEAWLGCGEVLDCIKVATAANPLETPAISSANRLRPPFQPILEPLGFQFHSLISPPCPAVCVSCVLGVENEGDDPLDWLRSSIPGEPGTDYPIMATTQVSVHYIVVVLHFPSFQDSGFSCDGLVFGGYYADPATECQQYSVCLQDPISPDTLYPVNFLCPNGTIFNQQLFNCDWWSVSFLPGSKNVS